MSFQEGRTYRSQRGENLDAGLRVRWHTFDSRGIVFEQGPRAVYTLLDREQLVNLREGIDEWLAAHPVLPPAEQPAKWFDT